MRTATALLLILLAPASASAQEFTLRCDVGLSEVTGTNVTAPTLHASGSVNHINPFGNPDSLYPITAVAVLAKNYPYQEKARQSYGPGYSSILTYVRAEVERGFVYTADVEASTEITTCWDSDSFAYEDPDPSDPPPSPEEEQDPGTEPKGDLLYGSPILVSVNDSRLDLTGVDDGVAFDLDGDGFSEQTSWTAEGADDGFLFLDRDGDGLVDGATELFGDRTPQPPSAEPNGFRALALLDDLGQGGNGDGWVTTEDAMFGQLRLWIDENHDGVSQGHEILTLELARIQAFHLAYRKAERRDAAGNQIRYLAEVVRDEGPGSRLAWDAFFQYVEP